VSFLSILRRRLWLIALSTATVVGVAAWLVTRETPQYRSSAVIRIIDGQPMSDAIDVLTSRTVLGRAVDREGLRVFFASTAAPADFVEYAEVSLAPEESGTIHLDFGEDRIVYGSAGDLQTAGYGDTLLLVEASFVVHSPPEEKDSTLHVVPRDTAIDYVLEHILPIPDPSAGIIEIVFTSSEPRIASRTVNAIIESYLEESVAMGSQDIRRRRTLLEEQLRATDSLLLEVQTGLGILQAQEQRGRLEAELRMHEGALNGILRARSSGRSAELLSPRSLPALTSDPVVGPLYSRLVAYRSDREGMLSGPSPQPRQHPDVQRLSTLIASIEDDLISSIGARIGALRAESGALEALQTEVSASMDDLRTAKGDDVRLHQSIQALQLKAVELRDQVQEARLEEVSKGGAAEIVESSTRALPIPSNAWIKLLLGLVAGLVLGAAAAVLREIFDDWLATRERGEESQEIEANVLIPTLAVIPAVTPYLVEPGSDGEIRPDALQSAGIEAYHRLRASILSSRWGLKTLVVTSAHPGEGKTTTSTNLAAAYARQGQKVVLVECDLRRPSLGRYFGISREIDLVDVLFENHNWRKALQKTKVPGLFVLLGEKSFPKSGDSLGGPEMKRLLAEISSEYDLVILDTSPLLVAADATALAPIVDGIVLIVRETRTDRGTVDEVIRRLQKAGGNVLGTVLNNPEGRTP
jgi:capsular exopolysaccharide synthesis family protein